MSFCVIGPAPKRDHASTNQSHYHDDLDVLNEEDVEISDGNVKLAINQSTDQSREESKHESLVVPKFDWKPQHKHHRIDHNCTLPQSPNDTSSHHFIAHHQSTNQSSRAHSRTSSRHVTADPSSLFNLMRMIKGQVFEIYTPTKSSTNQSITYTQQTAFIFYDAHQSKLGSIYWSFDKQSSNNLSVDVSSNQSTNQSDFGYVRVKDPRRSIQLGKVTSVQAGPTPEQQQHLITALPWTNFFTISTPSITLHVSHPDRIVIDQWLICLRDIYVQHDFEIREGQDTRGKENVELTMRSITASTKHFTPLFNAFIDPNDPSSVENAESTFELANQRTVSSLPSPASKSSKSSKTVPPIDQEKHTSCGGCVIL